MRGIGGKITVGKTGGGTVFGNGTRFVWRLLTAQELQGADATLVHAVEAGFVTM